MCNGVRVCCEGLEGVIVCVCVIFGREFLAIVFLENVGGVSQR